MVVPLPGFKREQPLELAASLRLMERRVDEWLIPGEGLHWDIPAGRNALQASCNLEYPRAFRPGRLAVARSYAAGERQVYVVSTPSTFIEWENWNREKAICDGVGLGRLHGNLARVAFRFLTRLEQAVPFGSDVQVVQDLRSPQGILAGVSQIFS